jgi:bifunctional DNase/RNase
VLAVLVAPNGATAETQLCGEHVGGLHLEYMPPNPVRFDLARLGASFEEFSLHALLFWHEPQRYTVVLRGKQSGSLFPFETGYVQACSIYGAIKVAPSDIPLTYDLFARVVAAAGGTLLSAVVDSYNMEAKTHNFHLVVKTERGLVKVKCRGSDAVGIAHFAGLPLKIDTVFLENSGGSARTF